MSAVQRYDIGRLARSGTVERTPSGGIRVPAALTRAGVLLYRNPDGSVRRELRLPEEVFKADSLATLKDAPVLVGHPAMISPENWPKYTCGHVSDAPKQDGNLAVGPLAIQSATEIARVDSGELSEISCGYVCREDHTPGTWQGQPYDLVQRDIKYNHVGLGPRGWGRAGADCALRLDSAYCDLTEGTPSEGAPHTVNKIHFDGQEYEIGSKEHLTALYTKLDSQSAILNTNKSEIEKRDGTIAGLNATIETQKKQLAAANDPARIDSLVASRVELVANARAFVGSDYSTVAKVDGKDVTKTDEQIQRDVIAKVLPSVKLDGRTAESISAIYDVAVQQGIRADSVSAIPGKIAEVTARSMQKTKQDSAVTTVTVAEPIFEAPALSGGKK